MGNKFIKPDPVILKGSIKYTATNLALELIRPKFFKAPAGAEASGQPDFYSWLGAPVWDAFRFLADTVIGEDGKEQTLNEELILEACLIEISQPKNIVKTAVQGTEGTIKEYINRGDFEITVDGVIVGRDANSPPDRQQMNLLRDRLNSTEALRVASGFLDFLDIDTVVVDRYKFGQIEGSRNAIGFSMELLSDTAYEIRFNKAQKSKRSAVFYTQSTF